MPMRAVTFDFGQTLAELDTAMLASRLAERGVTVAASALQDARPAMWRRYNEAIRAGLGGHRRGAAGLRRTSGRTHPHVPLDAPCEGLPRDAEHAGRRAEVAALGD